MSDLWQDTRTSLVRLGQEIRDKRTAEGMSQHELMLALVPENNIGGWNVPVISNIEKGRHVPSAYIGYKLSEWLLQSGESRHLVAVPTPARNTDPETSKRNRPTANTRVHRNILRMFGEHGPLAHFQLWALYDGVPPATQSRVRTAVKELVLTGWVEDTGKTITNDNGRACILWDRTIDKGFMRDNT